MDFAIAWYKHIYFETICTTYNMIIVTKQNLRIGTEALISGIFVVGKNHQSKIKNRIANSVDPDETVSSRSTVFAYVAGFV